MLCEVLISGILCLLFRAALVYINNCPTRCNTKQSIYYSCLFFIIILCTPDDGCGLHPKHVE